LRRKSVEICEKVMQKKKGGKKYKMLWHAQRSPRGSGKKKGLTTQGGKNEITLGNWVPKKIIVDKAQKQRGGMRNKREKRGGGVEAQQGEYL